MSSKKSKRQDGLAKTSGGKSKRPRDSHADNSAVTPNMATSDSFHTIDNNLGQARSSCDKSQSGGHVGPPSKEWDMLLNMQKTFLDSQAENN